VSSATHNNKLKNKIKLVANGICKEKEISDRERKTPPPTPLGFGKSAEATVGMVVMA
jgi:hypothetical protein